MKIKLRAKDSVSIPVEGYTVHISKGWEGSAQKVSGLVSIKFNEGMDNEIYGIFSYNDVKKFFDVEDGDNDD